MQGHLTLPLKTLALKSTTTASVQSLLVELRAAAGKPGLVVASKQIAILTFPDLAGFDKCKGLSNFWMTKDHSVFHDHH